jgi:VanZ family protein
MEPSWGGGYWEQFLINKFRLIPESAHYLILFIRKTIHFLGYGLFGILFWYYYYLWGFRERSILLSWFSILAVAGLDEYVQSQSGFRSGSLLDVLLDLCGAISISLAVNQLLIKKLAKNQK